jgi:very-short-patch-repair endonuclease
LINGERNPQNDKIMPRSQNTDRARGLRIRQTESEGRLWGALRNRALGGWKWKPQAPRGRYILDFYCVDARLVVELDGSRHFDPRTLAYDERRSAFLRSEGLDVLRIPSNAVFENLERVADAIPASGEGWRRREDREGVSIPSDLEDQVGAVCPGPRSWTGTAP